MGILSQIVTAIRGGATEVGESIVDGQALRILDQEIRDASVELTRSKDAIAGLMAQQKLAQEKAISMERQIDEFEGYAIQAMNKGDESLALDIANKIAELDRDANAERDLATSYSQSVAQTKQAIMQAESNLKRLKQQVDTVKATESAQRAQATIAARHAGTTSAMGTAMSSLERIKERQALQAAKFDAATELDQGETGDLQARLRGAGITGGDASGAAVLARLTARQVKALPSS